MEFRILGPLEVLVGGVSLPVSAPRERALLAALVLDANRVVSMNRLVSIMWDGLPPETARNQVQICVSSLRRIFAQSGIGHVIRTCPSGYQLDVIDGTIDAAQFDERTVIGALAANEGRWHDSLRNLRAALGLWRGSAAAGIESRVVQVAVAPLNEKRLAVVETCIGLELKVGNHAAVIGELVMLIDEYPLLEKLRAYQMLALHRAGRRAEALSAYREARRLFIEELGLDLGKELKQLERAILRNDASLDFTGEVSGYVPARDAAGAPLR
jgi:DNA-binding SARP family transcriptional activator